MIRYAILSALAFACIGLMAFLAIAGAAGVPTPKRVFILEEPIVGDPTNREFITVNGEKLWFTHSDDNGTLLMQPPSDSHIVIACYPDKVAETGRVTVGGWSGETGIRSISYVLVVSGAN